MVENQRVLRALEQIRAEHNNSFGFGVHDGVIDVTFVREKNGKLLTYMGEIQPHEYEQAVWWEDAIRACVKRMEKNFREMR